MSAEAPIESAPIDDLQSSNSVFRYAEFANASASPASNADLRHCETGALTNSLGLFVQLLLALIAFSCLIAKRYCEPVNHRRTWIVWFLDTSKQIIGAGTMHATNVLLSEVLYAGDPCTWYTVNFLLDSTLGLGVIFIGLRAAYLFGTWMTWDSFRFGEYGNPARMAVWFKQCSVYLVVILVEKLFIVLLTLLPIWRRLTRYAMNWTTSADLELVFVMFIIPLVVNAIIFWVVDNFLMQHKFDDATLSRGLTVSAHKRPRPRRLGCCHSSSFCCCCSPIGRSGKGTVSATKYTRLAEQSSPRQQRRHRQLLVGAASDRDEDAGDECGSGVVAGMLDLERRDYRGSHDSSGTGCSSDADAAALLLPPPLSPLSRGSGPQPTQKL